MKTKEKKLRKNIIWGAVVSLAGIICGLLLLFYSEKMAGTDCVAFTLGFAVIGLIIAFADEVQEFSIAGNGVKLKELRLEAERKIEELDKAKTELFRLMIPQILEGSQRTLDRVDPRSVSFLKVFDQIQSFGIINELRSEIEHVLHVLLICQYGNLKVIHQSSKEIKNSFEELDSPSLLFVSLNDTKVAEFMKYNNQYKDSNVAKGDLVDGIHAYAELYAIKIKLDKLATAS